MLSSCLFILVNNKLLHLEHWIQYKYWNKYSPSNKIKIHQLTQFWMSRFHFILLVPMIRFLNKQHQPALHIQASKPLPVAGEQACFRGR